MLGQAKALADLGVPFGATLTEREVNYLIANEFAVTAEDIVWRRSKLGLRMSAAEIATLQDWITAHHQPSASPVIAAGARP